jgi:hypothetical protein
VVFAHPAAGQLQHVVVVVPVDADVDEAQHVTEEHRPQRRQRRDAGAVRHFQLQHHDGDQDGDRAVAESFEALLFPGVFSSGRGR